MYNALQNYLEEEKMKLKDALGEVREVWIPEKGHPVEETVAKELLRSLGAEAVIKHVDSDKMKSGQRIFFISVAGKELTELLSKQGVQIPSEKDWVFFNAEKNNSFWLISSKPCFLYSGYRYIFEHLIDEDVSCLKKWLREISFSIEKSTFDLFLTQYARLIRDFKREEYIREYARLGFTHIEVNALAGPFPHEQGVADEFYPGFYTYCPGLDQFAASRLNQGVYPSEYLSSNLELLKENARLALRYGLAPVLLCFEPRSVPEEIFRRYPTLRGARVDHPFRSFKPRFNLSTVHPVVKAHYAELITKILREVPELECLTIWSNDSGSGFEHTKSLYVGRNGGAYLIREWKNDEEIARSAASNIISFFRLLRDAASQVNPRFRVITRLESFYGEYPYLWPELGDRIDVEVNSLLARGWENNYPHPQYPDVSVLGSAYHNALWEKEKKPAEELKSRKSCAFFYHSFCSHTNHEPLLGIPFPWLTGEKLRAANKLGISALAHVGGIQPPDKVPYAVNQEVFRLFQFEPGLDIDQAVLNIAERYAGEEYAEDLIRGWRSVETAIRHFMPLSIYTHYGAVWMRLLVRPLVPDIDRIPEEERAYYEKLMCTPIHNPNRVDLARDVLFELVSKDYARKAFSRIDQNVWRHLKDSIDLFKEKMEAARKSGNQKAHDVFEDQYFRVRALRCLYETLRNTAVWIYAVHEYLDASDSEVKSHCRRLLTEMMDREIQNCRELIQLWIEAPLEWMIVSGTVETTFIHGQNFPELVQKRISLMEKHKGDEPYIDQEYMFRVKNNPYQSV